MRDDPGGSYASESLRGELRFHHVNNEAAIQFLIDWLRIDDQRTGHPAAMTTVRRDFIEQKQTELQLRSLNETLEQQVRARTNAVVVLLTGVR